MNSHKLLEPLLTIDEKKEYQASEIQSIATPITLADYLSIYANNTHSSLVGNIVSEYLLPVERKIWEAFVQSQFPVTEIHDSYRNDCSKSPC